METIENIKNIVAENSAIVRCNEFVKEDVDFIEADFYSKKIKNIDILNGCKKCVFIPENSPIVYKIPFNGSLYGDGFDTEFEPFFYAGQRHEKIMKKYKSSEFYSEWDYCAFESFLYSVAESENLQFLFAKNKIEDNLGDFYIYSQPSCISFYEFVNGISYENESYSDENVFRRTVLPSLSEDEISFAKAYEPKWLLDVRDWYGIDTVIALLDFTKKYNLYDIHNENYGYLKETGAPIIFDYND